MGSLMAGWDSPILSSKSGHLGRQASFTKDEIEEFKNKQKLAEQEHLQAAACLAENLRHANQQDMKGEESKKADVDEEALASVEEQLERSNSFKDWWTKSNWAFLNEPAMKRMEAADQKYMAQFHIAAPTTETAPQPEGVEGH